MSSATRGATDCKAQWTARSHGGDAVEDDRRRRWRSGCDYRGGVDRESDGCASPKPIVAVVNLPGREA